MKHTAFLFLIAALLLGACAKDQLPGDDEFFRVTNMPQELLGTWYSTYEKYQTDGYRIGYVKNIPQDLEDKLGADFPAYRKTLMDNYPVADDDYYVYYDDQNGYNGEAPEGLRYGYLGVVRAVNIFPEGEGGVKGGAVIIEYFDGAYPRWTDPGLDAAGRPFFPIYYRYSDIGNVQMANAVDLEKLEEYNADPHNLGRIHYAIETRTLAEAIATFTAENTLKFIAWGVVLPQHPQD
jgi:hypothetical protein